MDELLGEDADELLYRGIMESLGYSRNRAAFLKLARLGPLAPSLPGLAKGCPAPKEHSEVRRLSEGDRRTGRRGENDPNRVAGWEVMDRSEWRFAGVRPGNQPLPRIEGAAALAARFLDTGLVRGLRPAVAEDGTGSLVRALMVSEGGRTLIGKSRALDIAVNHVLPFFHAWSILVEGRLPGEGRFAALLQNAPPGGQ